MSEKPTLTKTEKNQPTELKGDQLDEVQGGKT